MKIWPIVSSCVAGLLGVASISQASMLPGLGQVTGSVSVPKSIPVVPVYLYNAERSMGYTVFAIDGAYRAVDLLPGHYDITVQNGYMPSKDGLEMAAVPVDVTAGGHSKADLAPKPVEPTQNYTGRETYTKGVDVEPYDVVYPAGPGKVVLERMCIVCHGVNFIPSKTTSRAGWEALIHLMINGPATGGLFRGVGLIGGPPIIDRERRHLSDDDLNVLLDYLAANFGPDKKKRAVLQDEWPAVDLKALSKAEYIEYRFANTPAMPKRASQELHFDQEGNVYVSEPGERAIVKVDPRTGESKNFMIPDGASTHGITVDGDGTVWFSGSKNFVTHLDPKTGLFDQYQATERGLHGNTPVFNSKGDLWFSMLIGNKLGHWERATDTVTYYESPMPDADPYGLIIDHHDKVWYSEYFTGAVTRFDPETSTFKRFEVKTWPTSLRRLGVDSKDNIWYGVYGHPGTEKYGKIGRIDAKTGEITERPLPIEYSQPYDARPDPQDNVWISSMNYLSRLDGKKGTFTIYPTPERTDMPKIQTTRDGAVWFPSRGAGVFHGYGGSVGVLYPDKDAIRNLGAYYWKGSDSEYITQYHGPFITVTGAKKMSKDGALNADIPGEKTIGAPWGDANSKEGSVAE
jgi:virginiamycin B lyase